MCACICNYSNSKSKPNFRKNKLCLFLLNNWMNGAVGVRVVALKLNGDDTNGNHYRRILEMIQPVDLMRTILQS